MDLPKRTLPTAPKRTISSRAATPARTTPRKTFTAGPYKPNNDGEAIIIYGETGMGKTSLAATSPNPVFVAIDKGGRTRIKNPTTGEELQIVPDVETYADVRDVLQQYSLFDNFDTAVIDTVTILEDMAVPHMLATIPKEKGDPAKNIISYGYNKGYQHLYDLMKLILQDCDVLIHRGKNVILIAQSAPNKVSNPGGEDYLREGPRLYAGKPSVEALFCEWADHILRIDYENVWTRDKKASGDATKRVIYTKPEVYFRAKSVSIDTPVISFYRPADTALWQFMFPEVAK